MVRHIFSPQPSSEPVKWRIPRKHSTTQACVRMHIAYFYAIINWIVRHPPDNRLLTCLRWDCDIKRKVKQAARIQLSAPFLKIPQAMRAVSFMDEDSKSAARQMQVRQAQDAMQKLMPTNAVTVTVSSRSSPATGDLSVYKLRAALPSGFPARAGGAAVLPVLCGGGEW